MDHHELVKKIYELIKDSLEAQPNQQANSELRTNEGYIISNSLWVGNIEIVLGQHDGSHGTNFATWQYTGGSYYWGHYFHDRLSAEKDMYQRAIEKIDDLQFDMRSHGKKSEAKDQER